MARNEQIEADDPRTGMVLVELSVVLVANQNDPSILNPDFLRYMGIVDNALQLKESPISTPMFSQVIFEGGLNVRAEPNRFVFEQKGWPLRDDACVAPETAGRFVEQVSHVPYSAIGVNPKAVRLSNKETRYSLADAMVGGGKWMAFKDEQPDIHLKAVYRYESRTISLDVGGVEIEEDGGSTAPGLLFHANIHRDIGGKGQALRIERALSILASWKDDISDFNTLVARFLSREISR